jgi:hypothetical protein
MTSSPVKLKLAYFNDNKGRNELTRLIFAVGKVPYEDVSIGGSEYGKLRDSGSLPWGQLPVLHVQIEGGYEVFGQSCSIARFAAKKAGSYPTNDDVEALRTDGIVDSWRDTLDLYYDTVFERKVIGGRLMMFPHPPSARCAKLAAFIASELSQQFTRYEQLLQPTGQCCRNKAVPFPCWADLALYDLVKTMAGSLTPSQFSDLMEGKPTLATLESRIDAIDEIQSHLEKHPYKNTTYIFAPVSVFKRPLEMLLMPVHKLFMGLRARVRAITDTPVNEAAAA